MAWIESHQSLARHPKLSRLAAILKISRPAAVGHLHFLWWWCIDYTIDGDLSAFSANEIAAAAAWEGDAASWRSALEAAGFVDPDARIHDWHDYAGRLVLLREARRQAGKIGGIKSGAARRSAAKQCLKQTPSNALKQNGVLLEAPTNQPTVPTNQPGDCVSLIASLHRIWQERTGMQANQMTYERRWLDFITAGHREPDLELVIEHAKVLNKERESKYHVSLALGRIIEDLTKFSDRLCEAKAWVEAGRPLGKAASNGKSEHGFEGKKFGDAAAEWVASGRPYPDFREAWDEWEAAQP